MRSGAAASEPDAGREPVSVCLVGLLLGEAPYGSGVPRYAARLTRALDAVSPEFPELRLTLLTTPAGAEVAGPERLAVELVARPLRPVRSGPVRIAAEQLAAATRREGLLHFFDLTGPVLRPRRRFTTTMLDASIVHGFEKVRHAYKRRLYPWALRRAERVVAISEFAREEAQRHFGIPPGKIAVVRPGPGLMGTFDGARPDLPEPPFYLYVGDLTEKKNVALLVRAFDRADVSAGLVLVGRRRSPYPELEAALAAAVSRRVTVLENASDAVLDGLYRTATALLHPSRYEGFGFTPLEAMARGCPVVASDIPALREISGAGALLVPPGDEAAWADAIGRLAADEALRGELRDRGGETVARYSWAETARGLCRLFASLAAAPGRAA